MKRHVLILGAGFSGLEVAGRLSETASKWVDATLLSGASTDRPQTALPCGWLQV
jgi:NADH dehydrogenase FAD-containing subunit